MPDSRTAYLAAAASLVDQVAGIPGSALPGQGLGAWDLRALVGHTSRSLVTVESYLEQPAEVAAVPTAAHYYLAIAGGAETDGAAAVGRGRRGRGRAGGGSAAVRRGPGR